MAKIDIHKDRTIYIQATFILVAMVLIGMLANLQILNKDFQASAAFAGSSIQLEYPARGLLLDRNGKLLVANTPTYDMYYVYNQFAAHQEHFDTVAFCELLNIPRSYFEAQLDKDWKDVRYSRSKPELFLPRITHAEFARIQESLYRFPGFFIQQRYARAYPHRSGAHLLGYIGEVGQAQVRDSNGIYRPGDYWGITGLEHQYEAFLRGQKGIRRVKKDILGRVIGRVDDGKHDIPAVAGYNLWTGIDQELQTYAETLMQGKIGGIVAIEPASGEVLAMVSTPTYDPNRLVLGAKRGANYLEILNDSLRPFFNRSIMAQYPPGSLFKPIVALIGMQMGVLDANRGIACQGAYYLGGTRLTGCHAHPYCSNVSQAIQHSCNTYFVTVFRDILDRHDYEKTPRQGLADFNAYLRRFGLGQPLGLDFPGEEGGNVPDTAFFNKVYAAETAWKSVWLRSLAIGQGELLATNLQLANLAAIIANRGYYITPHLAKALQDEAGHTFPPPLRLEKRYVGIDPKHFEPVVDGMEWVVQAGTARAAQVPGIAVCGKTGTAENNQGSGKDHSIFFAFAPKDNPQIALAVYIENGGFGGTYAAPIASLLIEKYLKHDIDLSRKWLETRMMEANLIGRP
ncbi:MAG: penicillin-binding protein 2 [Bacteroidetes bacterium]|nr:MAG: penicillin-binding protein 2 [Bacteroidota bacterium]